MEKQSTISTHLIAIGVLIVLSFGIYANSLQNGFVWDDKHLFIDNSHRWDWRNLRQLLLGPDDLFGITHNPYYRPLPNVTFLLDRYLWGRQAFGFHLSNILFHVFCTIAVFYTSRAILNSLPGGFVSGLIFALHPIHTEAVAWISGRNNVLAGLFYVLAFYYYVRFRQSNRLRLYVLSVVSFAFSLISKEYAVTLPVMVMLYEICCLKKQEYHGTKSPIGTIGKLSGPYLLMFAVYVWIRSVVLAGYAAVDLQWETFYFRLLTVPKIIFAYLKLLAFPIQLNAFHTGAWVESPYDPEFALQTASVVSLLCIWGISLKKSPPLFMCLSWFLVTLLPVLNVLPIPNSNRFIAERYMYIPAVGFSMFTAWGFMKFFGARNTRQPLRRYGAVFLLLLVAEFLGFETIKRNWVWHNDVMLWQDTVEKSADSFMVRFNLSIALYKAGRRDEALAEIVQAVRLNPNDSNAHFIHGVILYEKKKFDQSLTALESALELNPEHRGASEFIHKIRTGSSPIPLPNGN